MLFLLRACVLLLFNTVLVETNSVIVNTTLGPVEGIAAFAGKCGSFYGIPYAHPPTGQNRFKPPQPATRWTATRPAFRNNLGRSCLQTFGDAFINLSPFLEKLAENFHIGMEPMSEVRRA